MSFEDRLDAVAEVSDAELFDAAVGALGFSPRLISGNYLEYQVWGAEDQDEGFYEDEDTDMEDVTSEEDADEEEADEEDEDEVSLNDEEGQLSEQESNDEDEDNKEDDSDEDKEEASSSAAPTTATLPLPGVPAINAPAVPAPAINVPAAAPGITTAHARCAECARKHKKCVRPSGRGSCEGCLRARGGPKVCSLTQ